MSKVFEEYQKYRDSWGLYQNLSDGAKGITTGNGIRYTAQMVAAVARHGGIRKVDWYPLRDALRNCEPVPGLLQRSPDPGHNDYQEGPDDYVGAFLIDFLISTGFSKRFLEHGRNHKYIGLLPYVYNNKDHLNDRVWSWDKKAWLGRQQQLVAIAQIIAGEPLPPWREIWLRNTLIAAAQSSISAQDEWILSWMLVLCTQDHSSANLQKARSIWRENFQLVSGGVGGVLKRHYGSDPRSADHPDTKWLLGEDGKKIQRLGKLSLRFHEN